MIEELGFDSQDRVVVVHVDDVGMCDAANAGAWRALADAATCGSVMVPCPAFPAVAARVREHPELDLGVHLTLCCEYPDFRFGPVAKGVSSLRAADGGLWRDNASVVDNARPEHVETELRAQIETALEAGIDVTHVDAHMGTVFELAFVHLYVDLAREFELPMFIPRIDRALLTASGMSEQIPDRFVRYIEIIESAEAAGFPIFDHFSNDSLHFAPGTAAAHNRARVDAFGPGISYLITHCALGNDELRAIAPDWQCRHEEHEIYSDGTMRDHFAATGVRTIGMRPLRDWMRARSAPRGAHAQ